MNRREFTKTTALGFGAGLTFLNGTASVFGVATNEKINLGFIGCGGRGRQLLGDFMLRNDVNVLHCCDPFRQRAETAVGLVEGSELTQVRQARRF